MLMVLMTFGSLLYVFISPEVLAIEVVNVYFRIHFMQKNPHANSFSLYRYTT